MKGLHILEADQLHVQDSSQDNAHSHNTVRHRHRQQETWEKPQQTCACRRQGLQACSHEGELLSTSEVTGTMKVIALESVGEAVGPARPGSLHTSPELTAAEFLNWAEMIQEQSLWPTASLQATSSPWRYPETDLKVKKSKRERVWL